MRVTIHHIEKGPAEMYPVDATHAVGSHPLEWSRAPWSDEAKAETMPKLKQKRADEKKAREAEMQERAVALSPYDPNGFKVVGPMAGQTQQAPAGGTASDPLAPPYAGGDPAADGFGRYTDDGQKSKNDAELAQLEKQADEQSRAVSDAQVEVDAARGRGDDKAADKAQKKVDGLQKALDETNAKIDAKLGEQ